MVCALVVAAFVTPVSAQQAGAKAKAKARFEAAEKFLAQKSYDDAIREYQAAYELLPVPAFFFNIATAYRLKGSATDATLYFQRYLDAEPKGKVAKDARQWIQDLAPAVRVEKAKMAAAEAEEARKAEAARQAEEARKAEEAREAREAEAAEVAPPVLPKRKRRGGGLKIAGLITGVVGLGLIGGGIFYGLEASRLSDELSADDATFSQSKLDDGEAADTRTILLTSVGAGAVVLGGVLYWLGARQASASEQKLGLRPDLRRLGLVLEGRFE